MISWKDSKWWRTCKRRACQAEGVKTVIESYEQSELDLCIGLNQYKILVRYTGGVLELQGGTENLRLEHPELTLIKTTMTQLPLFLTQSHPLQLHAWPHVPLPRQGTVLLTGNIGCSIWSLQTSVRSLSICR